jgi:hypothetical protein
MKHTPTKVSILIALCVFSSAFCAGDESQAFPKPPEVKDSPVEVTPQPLEQAPDNLNGRKLKGAAGAVTIGSAAISLATQIAGMISNVDRSVLITIENKTNKDFTNPLTYFDMGELATPLPMKIRPGEAAVVGVKKKFGAFGVKGVICYRYDDKSDLVVFFENPYKGSNFFGAEIYANQSNSPKSNYISIPKIPANTTHRRYEPDYDIYSRGTSGNKASQLVTITAKAKPEPPKPQPAPSNPQPAATPSGSSLISFHNTRIRAMPDGRVDLTTNNDTWEKWTVQNLGDSKFTFKSFHGTFLRAYPNGYVDLAPEAREWETWTKQSLNGRDVWRSHHGTFLRGYPDGRIDLAREAKEWETWSF